MRSLLLLVASAASLSLAPPEICVDGVWNEASNSVLEAAQALPHVRYPHVTQEHPGTPATGVSPC
jgi:hypothetical protein